MIRCVRIWTGDDGDSLFEEGWVDLPNGEHGDVLSGTVEATGVSFRQTEPGGSFSPHQAPIRQYVVTLAGTLEFKTAKGTVFTIRPGDVLLAEDTTGSGHSWRLIDDQPWRRAYVVLAPGEAVPFVKAS